MNFVQFLAILRARYKVALGVFAVIVLGALVVSLVWPKSYTAAASVVIDSSKPDPLSAVLYSGGLNPSLVATQIDVIQSDRVAFKVVRNLKLTRTRRSASSGRAPPRVKAPSSNGWARFSRSPWM